MNQQKVDDLVPKPPVQEERLSSSERAALSTSQFAEPKKRKYPIEDKSHARNALARVSQHGSSSEKAQVRSAVKRKYPGIHQAEAAAANKIVNRVLEMEYPGVGSPMPPDTSGISADELDMGRAIEMEHTDDPTQAEALALDHLREDPHYYTKMHRCGLGKDTSPPKSYMVGSAAATNTMSGAASASTG